MLPEPEINSSHVLHKDEIPHLTAVRIAVAALEQLGILPGQHLIVKMEGHAGHAALVLLPGAVDIEVAQSDHLGGDLLLVLSEILVKEELGVAVNIKGLFKLPLLDEVIRAAAVGGG